ncbi:dihydrofolate reductase family protein [Salinicola avicenniae]|uniref:dihydrofolate reductase family protein n=1 Tax=Salinicola avicenniae TaxID=2916836 RepID=UPI0021F7DBD6|nr:MULTISPECIES: dihydrofolate reductase family protein [unclassified Salinicola]
MRPRVISHMITSLDGRLLPQRWNLAAQGWAESDIEQVYESAAAQLAGDAWLVGRRTLAGYFAERTLPEFGPPVGEAALPFIGDRQGRGIAVVMDPAGRYCYDAATLDEDHLVVVLSTRVDEAYRQSLRQAGVSYTFAGADGHDVRAALESLGKDFGLSRVLLEGGGIVNGAFLAADCIDEVSTLIVPVIDGIAGIPSTFDHRDEGAKFPHALAQLKLTAQQTLEKGVIWLRHDVIRSPGVTAN